MFTRIGTDRDHRLRVRAGGRARSKRICSATKSNGIIHTMPFWDERFALAREQHPDVAAEQVLIDALCAMVVLNPGRFDVIVASNLFGDILSDLAAAAAGSIGIAPSANLNPEHEHPSMFEPVHGSAPDIAGQERRQPGRRRVVGGDDARAPRRAGGGRRDHGARSSATLADPETRTRRPRRHRVDRPR